MDGRQGRRPLTLASPLIIRFLGVARYVLLDIFAERVLAGDDTHGVCLMGDTRFIVEFLIAWNVDNLCYDYH